MVREPSGGHNLNRLRDGSELYVAPAARVPAVLEGVTTQYPIPFRVHGLTIAPLHGVAQERVQKAGLCVQPGSTLRQRSSCQASVASIENKHSVVVVVVVVVAVVVLIS